jgi:hypothetical protein
MVADETGSQITTYQCETAAGIGFGLAVSQGTADTGAIIGGSAFIGVTVRDVTQDRIPIDPLAADQSLVTSDVYPQRANMGILSRGRIWVTANGGGDTGVKAGDPLFYDTTTGVFTNSTSGAAASGSVVFTTNPVDGQTLTLNGDVWTFKATGESGLQSNIGPTLGDTLTHLVSRLNASASALTENLVYAAYPPSPGGAGQGSGANTLVYGAEAVGTAGNSITVTTNVPGTTVTAAAGGSAAATAVTGGYWASSAIAGQLAQITLGIQR